MPPAAIPALAAAIPAITGGAAAGGSLLLGGKGNTYQADPFSKTEDYNANAFNYGGYAGGANDAANQYGSFGKGAREKAQEYGAQQAALYNAGVSGLTQGQASRDAQNQAAYMMMQRAQGIVPSIAQMQADRQMTQLANEQASAAAGARGPAALALAQQQAAGNTSAGQANISGQAQINAAQERLAAEQAAFGAYSGMRGQDYDLSKTAFGAGAQSGQLGLGHANLGMQFNELQNRVREAQLQAQMKQQGMLADSRHRADEINSGIRAQEVARNDAKMDRFFDMAGKGAQAGGSLAGGGAGAKPSSGGSSGGSNPNPSSGLGGMSGGNF
jgi:hypothetical protein